MIKKKNQVKAIVSRGFVRRNLRPTYLLETPQAVPPRPLLPGTHLSSFPEEQRQSPRLVSLACSFKKLGYLESL